MPTPREQLSIKAQRKLKALETRYAKIEDRIAILMSQRVDIEEQMAAVYDDPR